MVMGVIQADLLPKLLGFEHPATWILTLAGGLLLGVILGAFQGFVIAYLGIPAFIVTLGGLLVWRGAAWWVTSGQTVAPLDRDLQAHGRRSGRLDRRDLELGGRHRRLRRGRAVAGTRPRPAKAVPLPAAADGGRNLSWRRRLRRDPCRGRNRQRLSLADRQRPPLRRSEPYRGSRRAAFSSRMASQFRF